MIKALFCIVALLSVGFKQRRELVLENLALRQQLAVFNRNHKRLRLRRTDRLFWVWISRIWERWRESPIVVKPDTESSVMISFARIMCRSHDLPSVRHAAIGVVDENHTQ